MAINLLPSVYKTKSKVFVASSLLKKITYFSLFVTILGLIAAVVTLLLLEREKQTLLAESQTLEQNVKSLEKFEQKYVLLKDRIQKGQEILKISDYAELKEYLDIALGYLPQEGQLTAILVEKGRIEISFSSSSAIFFRDFFEVLSSDPSFNGVSLKSFGYVPGLGYKITLSLFPKI